MVTSKWLIPLKSENHKQLYKYWKFNNMRNTSICKHTQPRNQEKSKDEKPYDDEPEASNWTVDRILEYTKKTCTCDSSEQYIISRKSGPNNKTVLIKLGPKLTKTVKGKLSLGTKILHVGGVKKIFKQNFSVKESEKLQKAFQCYLSTTAGPISGLLFISTEKLAFCSEKSIEVISATGSYVRVPYKVSIPLKKIQSVNGSKSLGTSSQKYVQLVTHDNFEFWFMGLLNYRKSLRFIQDLILDVNYSTCNMQDSIWRS